jgi:hypothetical protein
MMREIGDLLKGVIAQANDTAALRDRAKQVGTACAATRTLSSNGIRDDTVLDSVPPLLPGCYTVSGTGSETDSAGSKGVTQQETVNGRFGQQGWEFP